jgi:hypothetical protein
MIITVLSAVKTPATAKSGKPYTYLELAYKGNDGKVNGKKVMPFGESRVVFESLSQAQPGEAYDVTMVKNEGTGYWDWTNAKKADGTATNTVTSSVAITSAERQPAGKVTGSNYETPEERAKKQVYIIKQSSISSAIALSAQKKVASTVEEILGVAKQFEAYVVGLETSTPPVAVKVVDTLAEMDDDIPY